MLEDLSIQVHPNDFGKGHNSLEKQKCGMQADGSLE
jgi:mannose-6-phosphate isomerase class I